MASFAYKARGASGQLIEGVLEGASSGAVADVLIGQGAVPVEIRETGAGAKAGESFSLNFNISCPTRR